MAIELAAVYVPITPSLKGAAAKIQAELGGVDVSGIGSKVGESFGSKIVDAMGGVMKAGAVAVTGVAVAGIGTALVKGFARLDAIDVARAKLTGLGNDADTVKAIMTDALSSVKGTAFGLGEAATVAAAAVAANIRPGEQLQGHLKNIANNAAAAGVSMEEMGSIFNKAATQANGVQNDVIGQLADKGIPIYQKLAEQMGVTAGEVFKLASDGKIDFETFSAAATAAAGTVADQMGGTVRGSLANFFASLGRIGAGLLGGVFPQIAPTVKGITAALEPLEAVAARVGDRIGQAVNPALQNFVGIVSGNVKVGWITTLGFAFTALFSAFNGEGITSGGLVGIFESIGVAARQVVDAFTPLIPALAAAWANLSPLAVLFRSLEPVFPALAGAIGAIVASALPGFVTLLTAASTIVGGLASAISDVIAGLIPAIDWMAQYSDVIVGLGAAVGAGVIAFNLWKGAVAAWTTIMAIAKGVQAAYIALTYGQIGATYAGAAAQAAFNLVMNANPIMLIVTAIAALVAGLVYFFTQTELGKEIWANFTKFLGEAWANIVNVATTVWNALADFFTGLWNGIVDGVTTAWNAVADFLRPAFEVIGGIIQFYIDTWKNIFMVLGAVLITIWQWISKVFTDAWNGIVSFVTPIVQSIVDFVVGYFTTLFNFWSGVWQAVSDFFTGIWNGLVDFVTPIVLNIYKAVAGPISALQSWWNGVWNAISGFFTGIWDGMLQAVVGTVSGIIRTVRGVVDTVMSVFNGIGTWLIDSGKALLQGFIDGIMQMVKPVGDAINGVLDWAAGFFPHSPAKRGTFAGTGWTGLTRSGQAIMEQLALGFANSPLQDALNTSLPIRADATATARWVPGDIVGAPATTAQGTVNQYITTQQTDPRIQAREWAREAQRAVAAT
ncbi:tape measure protein [Microbacterium sp.]|uniref:phage tail protein n=1 Tax=Microbacterium sp. TaxID=51671 RepID=UPI0032420EB6